MPEQIAYEEEWESGDLASVKVGVQEGETRLFVAAKPITSDHTYELSTVDQRGTTLLKGEGLRLLPFAIDRLQERFDLELFGLESMLPTESEESLDDIDEEDVDDPPTEYDTVEDYLEAVDEATTQEIAEATGLHSDHVHTQLFELPDERLEKRRDPDDGRRKLYSLKEIDGSPPGDMTEGGVVEVANYYNTLEAVAKDMEVSEDRARAILREHDVLDEVET